MDFYGSMAAAPAEAGVSTRKGRTKLSKTERAAFRITYMGVFVPFWGCPCNESLTIGVNTRAPDFCKRLYESRFGESS